VGRNNRSAKSLVLVHGYLGGSEQWELQRRHFSNHFDVFTPDLPGFGNSSSLESPSSICGYADHVIKQINEKGINRFHLLGHSMGGMIVQEIVRKVPNRVDKLVLYGTGSIGSLPGRFESLAESRKRVIDDGVIATSRRIAATWFLQLDEAEHYPLIAEIAAKASQQAALNGLTAMEHWKGEQHLKNISADTLIIWGDRDRAYPWQQEEILWKNIANSYLSVVPGCSHAVHLEKTQIFNHIVLDFLLADEASKKLPTQVN